MKRTLALLLVLCLLAAALPVALADEIDLEAEEAVEVSFQDAGDGLAAVEGPVIDLSDAGDSPVIPEDTPDPLPQDDAEAAAYARFNRQGAVWADAQGSEALLTLPEGSCVLVVDAENAAVKVAFVANGQTVAGYVDADCLTLLGAGDASALVGALAASGDVSLYEGDLDRPLPKVEPLADESAKEEPEAADEPDGEAAPEDAGAVEPDPEDGGAAEQVGEDIPMETEDEEPAADTTDEIATEGQMDEIEPETLLADMPRESGDADDEASDPSIEAGYISSETETEYADIESSADSDELFAGYTSRIFYNSRAGMRRTMATAHASSQLAGQDKIIYDILKPEILKVAAGEREGTIFTIPMSTILGQTVYTAKELGIEIEVADSKLTEDSKTRISNALSNQLTYSLKSIANALWLDCTYELYWLDRYSTQVTANRALKYSAQYDRDQKDYVFTVSDTACVDFKFPVLGQYAGSTAYKIDTSLISGAEKAAANAKAIVSKYAGYPDYVKLYGYAKEICDLVSYNNDAVKSDWNLINQDPWKLIWVFDGDSSTNVVCEGYAQAFQYLCELTSFNDGIRCIMVTGYAGEAHSWNIVRMDDGKNYAVDVTWMDGEWDGSLSGDIADWISQERGQLFLCGGTGSVSDGYTINYRSNGRTTSRIYRAEDTLTLYPASALTLAGSKYVLTGWQKIGGSRYYFDSEGHYLTDVQSVGDIGYSFSDSGKLISSQVTGWQTIGNDTYYFDEDGTMHTGWLSLDGKEYLFEDDGTLHTDHTPVTDEAVAPSCTEDGLTEGSHCSVCNAVLVAQETDPAKGHTVVTDKAVAPSCTEDGLTEGSHCSVCNAVLVAQKPVAAKGHTVVTDEAVAPSCTEDGLAEGSHCSVCNAVLVAQKPVAAKGHTVVTDKAVAPTCTEDGLTEGSHCSVCNAVLVVQRTDPAKGHTVATDAAVAPSCTDTGLTEGSHCSVCNAVLIAQEPIPAKGHTPVTDPAVASTYTATGLTEGSHCSVCGTILVVQEVAPVLDPTFHMKKSATKKVNVGDLIQIIVDGQTIKSCKSSDKKVASVTKKGRVTAKGAGTAKITVTLKNKKKLTLTVKVTDPYAPKSIKIVQGKKATLTVKQKLTLGTTLTPDYAVSKLTWTSSDSKVATVSKKGVVTAKKAGKAKITVTTANGKKATITITVKK